MQVAGGLSCILYSGISARCVLLAYRHQAPWRICHCFLCLAVFSSVLQYGSWMKPGPSWPFQQQFLDEPYRKGSKFSFSLEFSFITPFDDYWYCSLPSPAFAGRAVYNIVLNVRMAFAYGVSFSGKHYLGSLWLDELEVFKPLFIDIILNSPVSKTRLEHANKVATQI